MGSPVALATAMVALICLGQGSRPKGFGAPTSNSRAVFPGIGWSFEMKPLAGVASGQVGSNFSAGPDLDARFRRLGATVTPR